MRRLPSFDHDWVTRLVQRSYGIKVDKITPFRNVFKLETNLGKMFFKPFYLKEKKLRLIVKAKEHLLKKGFPQLIPFVPTLDGQPYCSHGKQVFYMTHWIEGHPCNYDNPFELKLAVQLFARFHLAAKNFIPPDEMPSHLGKWDKIFEKRLRDLENCQIHAKSFPYSTFFEKSFLQQIDMYINQAEKAISLLKESTYQQMCQKGFLELPFCHHDPAHHNILITSDNQPLLIDFDYLLQDLHLHDLASLIIRNGKASDWNLKRCKYLLKSYQVIKPITPEELKVIYAFITFPFDIWLLAKARYIEKEDWPVGYFLKEWKRKTINENFRQKFLKEFFELLES